MKGDVPNEGSRSSSTGEPEWLIVREAARRLRIPSRQLYDLIDEGELDAYHFEDDLKLRAADVAGFADPLP
jgi:excisionase family DNA binding protein